MSNLKGDLHTNQIQIDFINSLYERYNTGETAATLITKTDTLSHNKTIEFKLKKNLGEKLEKLDDDKQASLFMLLESNYCYRVWKKNTFVNYLLANKKKYAYVEKKGIDEINQQLIYFHEQETLNTTGIKNIKQNEDEYFLRLIFIEHALKGIVTMEEVYYQNEIFKHEVAHPVATGSTEVKRGGGKMMKGAGKFSICKSRCKIFVEIAVAGFLWIITTNNLMNHVEHFLPEVEHLAKFNFEKLIKVDPASMTHTKSVLMDWQLQMEGVPPESIPGKIKERNLMHINAITTKLKLLEEHLKQATKKYDQEKKALSKMSNELVAGKKEMAQHNEKTIKFGTLETSIATTNIETGTDVAKRVAELELYIISSEYNHELELYIKQDTIRQEKNKKRLDIYKSQLEYEKKESVNNPDYEPIKMNVSYAQITQMLKQSPWTLFLENIAYVYKNATQVRTRSDVIKDFEVELAKAFAYDSIAMVNKNIVNSYVPVDNPNKNSKFFEQLVSSASDLMAMVWYGKDINYKEAPGTLDKLKQIKQRLRRYRQDGRNWQLSMETALDDFQADILLHMRTTSYYLWIYSVMQNILVMYAVRLSFKFLKGEDEQKKYRHKK